jgi:hypothetical protein
VFAEFVQKLSVTPDGENTMLENALLMYGSNMSDSNLHNNFPLPTALVGGAAGILTGQRHLRYNERTPLANLHLTLLNKLNIDSESLGDSNGLLGDV